MTLCMAAPLSMSTSTSQVPALTSLCLLFTSSNERLQMALQPWIGHIYRINTDVENILQIVE
jgi:hypothetical protein